MRSTFVFLASLSLAMLANAAPVGVNLGASKAVTQISTQSAQGEFSSEDFNIDQLEFQLADEFDGFSGDFNTAVDPVPHIDFKIPQLPSFNFTAWATTTIKDDEIPPQVQREYEGIFDKMCDSALSRFWKLGQCISKTDAYQQLNSSFWYQAAKQQLCGYPMQWESSTKEKPTWSNLTLPTFNFTAPHLNKTVQTFRKDIYTPISTSNTELEKAVDINDELQAEYLYVIQKKYGNAKNITSEQIKAIGQENSLPEMDKRGIGAIIGYVTGGSSLTTGACMKLCDQIRIGANKVDQCWEVTGLSVLYGVCNAGCMYYI
ncbi:hypothetical protein DASC09_011250 [Saccharomycopsis crataegensis]|uniref:Secreted protein n=1 Tax=Saccharomycopsis crataegensis TaxID=43959 RepID=A0AAV5QHF4_9ASCO|nr:hypothetical protein DASC09_011250 [Saccharomycopsis crataegensis]